MIGLDNEAEIIEQADVVLLMGPPASQQRMLRVVGRHLRPGQALGAIPGGGGFGWKAGRFLQSQVRQGVALFALPVCPWRCRTAAGGEGAEFLATVQTPPQDFLLHLFFLLPPFLSFVLTNPHTHPHSHYVATFLL
jgi:hypothetical protein